MQSQRQSPMSGPGGFEPIPEPASGAPVDPFPYEADAERRRRIAEAAYYRSLAQGFPPGRDQDDWLEAERELYPAFDPGDRHG